MYGARKAPVLTLEFHRCAIECGELLQPLRRNGVIATTAVSTIGMQHGHTAAISLFELGQTAAGVQSQNLVQVEKIGLVSQATSPVLQPNSQAPA